MHSVLWDCWRVYVLVLLLEVVHSTPKIMFSFKYCNDRLRIIRSFFLRDSKVSEIRQSARDFFFLLTPWPTPKPLANGRNIVGQDLSTLLDDTTYCVPLHILLHVVASVWTPLQHLRQPSLELLLPFALSLTLPSACSLSYKNGNSKNVGVICSLYYQKGKPVRVYSNTVSQIVTMKK